MLNPWNRGAAEGTLEGSGDLRAGSMAPDPVSASWPVSLLPRPVSLRPDLGCWQLERRGFCPQLE